MTAVLIRNTSLVHLDTTHCHIAIDYPLKLRRSAVRRVEDLIRIAGDAGAPPLSTRCCKV
jgi:hypothetical protein